MSDWLPKVLLFFGLWGIFFALGMAVIESVQHWRRKRGR